DSAIYRVAASSYLGTGQTGYSDFATPAQDKPQVFHHGKGIRISVLVCEALADGAKDPSVYGCGLETSPLATPQVSSSSYPNCLSKDPPTSCHTVEKESDYAVSQDDTKQISGLLVADNREQLGAVEYLKAQVRELVAPRAPFKNKSDKKAGAEYAIENYPYLDVYLEKLSIGGSLNTALASRATTAKFSGVQASDIPQPTKSELNWDTKLRVLRRDGRWDLGGALDEQFDKSVQGSLTKPSIPNWSRNMLTIGPVLQFSITDPRTTPRLLVATHFDYVRQITSTTLFLSGASGSQPIPALKQLPNQGYQPKVGMRYESGDSYFEAGGVYSRTYDVLSQVAGLPGGAICNLTQDTTLSSCVGN